MCRMPHAMKKVGFIVLISMLSLPGIAQRTCGTVEYNALLEKSNPNIKSKEVFEDWLEQKKQLLHSPSAMKQLSEETTIYQIPVVVHVIHNGETEGTGTNISFDQIVSQIDVLNEDFQRLNADSVNTPGQFQLVASNIGFEFVLAKRDPNGLQTNGVTRTQGSQSAWSMSNNAILKSQSYWPADDYLNIWVAPLSGDLLGWAEFPVTSLLTGLDGASGNPITDGLVITYDAFGSIEKYPAANLQSRFNLGRSTSHEMGHFFGLRHIWGDGDCSVDDYVTDTPDAADSYFNCPVIGSSTTSCSSQDMFMNYMDYTDDDCMNLFTIGQQERMLIIINNSPRRLSLLTSPALQAPPVLDLAITDMLAPAQGICTSQITPVVEIFNVGETTITAVEIAFFINGSWVSQQTFPTAISTYENVQLTLNPINLTQFGTLELKAQVLLVNGLIDASADNNEFLQTSLRSEVVTTLSENFNTWPDDWSIRTDAPLSAWNTSQAPNLALTNQASLLSYYKNPSDFTDELITPMLNLDQVSNAMLQFQLAYGYRYGSDDELKVLVSSDCGNTFPDTLLHMTGAEMATAYLPVEFTPSGPRDWQSLLLDLTPYLDQMIQVKFVGSSDGGNNLYLDDIKLLTAPVNDLALVDLENETGVVCADLSELGVVIENKGTEPVTNFTLMLFENDTEIVSQQFVNLNLPAGAKQTVYLQTNLAVGAHNLEIKIDDADDFIINNSMLRTVTKSAAMEIVPYREQFASFNSLATSGWVTTADYDHPSWQVTPTGGSNFSARYQAYTTGNKGVHSWLVSPRLDLTYSSEASMHFDLSYAANGNTFDLVRIWASTDCGASFSILLDELYGSEIAVSYSSEEWNPSSEFDWRKFYVDLTEFAGMSDLFIGFEAIDNDGNNIFIDNIEFFVSANESPVAINTQTVAAYPNPVSTGNLNLTFNLEQKEDVDILIYDALGNTVHQYHLQDVLNQTFPIEIITTTSGMYYMKVVSRSLFNTLPIIVSR